MLKKKTYVVIAGQLLMSALIIVGIKLSNLKRMTRSVEAMGVSMGDYIDGFFFARMVFMATVGIILPIFICTLAGDLVAGEIQDGSLKLHTTRPRPRSQIILSKIIALFICALGFSLSFGLFSLLLGIPFFGVPGAQLVPYLLYGMGMDFALYPLGEAMLRYVGVMIYAAFAIMNLGCITLAFSCLFNHMTSATIAGITVYFISFVVQGMPFLDGIKPYLLSTIMSGSKYLYLEAIPVQRVLTNFLLNIAYIIGFGAFSFWIFRGKDIK